jgi:hypothetical protein
MFETYPLALLTINPTLELLLRAVNFGLPVPMSVIITYNNLLFCLSKDASSRKRSSAIPPWKLPNSNLYKNYGEAKTRIKHLIRKGTTTEKTVIYAMSPCILVGIYLVIIAFFVFGPSVFYQWQLLIILPLFLLFWASERAMWNTIQ